MARRPSARISVSKAERLARLRLVRTISAPALARARAKFWPSPRLVPVMIAVFPERSKSAVLVAAFVSVLGLGVVVMRKFSGLDSLQVRKSGQVAGSGNF